MIVFVTGHRIFGAVMLRKQTTTKQIMLNYIVHTNHNHNVLIKVHCSPFITFDSELIDAATNQKIWKSEFRWYLCFENYDSITHLYILNCFWISFTWDFIAVAKKLVTHYLQSINGNWTSVVFLFFNALLALTFVL